MKLLHCIALIIPFACSSPITSPLDNTLPEVPHIRKIPKRCPVDQPLDCQKCPSDARCRRPKSVSPPFVPGTIPGSDPSSGYWPFLDSPDSIYQPKSINRPRPHYWTYDPSEPAALTGPQLPNFDGFKNPDGSDIIAPNPQATPDVGTADSLAAKSESARTCPLTPCDGRNGASCGASATCTSGYCACAPGMKARNGYQGRGSDGVEETLVFVNPGVVCNQQCGYEGCQEVNSMSGCFRDAAGTEPPGQQLPSDEDVQQQEVVPKNPGTGVINIPGAAIDDVGAGLDNVAGVADAGAIGANV